MTYSSQPIIMSRCWEQASSQSERAWAVVLKRAHCGFGTSHIALNCFKDLCWFHHDLFVTYRGIFQKPLNHQSILFSERCVFTLFYIIMRPLYSYSTLNSQRHVERDTALLNQFVVTENWKAIRNWAIARPSVCHLMRFKTLLLELNLVKAWHC